MDAAGRLDGGRRAHSRGFRGRLEADAKPPDCVVSIGFAGIEPGRGELRTVRRVGEILGLKTQALTLTIGDAVSPDQLSGQEVSGVELQSRLGGQPFHRPA